MPCPNQEQLAAYQTGLLGERTAQAVRTHVDACAACRRELAALATTMHLVEGLPTPALPDDLWPAVAARMQPRRVSRLWWKTAVAGVAVAASLYLGLVMAREPEALPTTSVASASYVTTHELLAAQDPLADRASLGVLLLSQRGDQ